TLKNLDELDVVTEYIKKEQPKTAVVFGAGFIGLEVAESLIEAGWEVSVIDIANTVVKLDKDMSSIVENELTDNGVKLYLNAFTKEVDPKNKQVVLKDGRKIPYDMIFATAGIKPNTEFIAAAGIKVDDRGIVVTNAQMQTSDKDVYAGGDIVYTPHILTGKKVYSPLAWGANRQARVIANHIAGIKDQQPPTFNTAIIKIFRKDAAQTGLSEFAAKQEGFDAGIAIAELNHHAGYYPGAKKVVIKLIFDKKSLKVLGAQAVGQGADKKIDVIATSIQAQSTIYELLDLNLSYSPPYGSARDVVNVVASIAVNAVERDIKTISGVDVPKEATIIDVRPETVFSMGTLHGAINIDKEELRTSDKLPKDKKEEIYLLCNTGHESYNSWGILTGMGYKNLINIEGGLHHYEAHEKAINYDPKTAAGNKRAGQPAQTAQAAQATQKVAVATGKEKTYDVDCTGLSCPGPILKVADKLKDINDGDVINVTASDFGFETDIKVWTKKNGHTLLNVTSTNDEVVAQIAKGSVGTVSEDAKAMAGAMLQGKKKATIVLFSGSYDKMIAAMIISQAAASLGTEVTIFATFWGLNALRTKPRSKLKKTFIEKRFAGKMPRGAGKLPLSQMNMGGMGKKMIKSIMKKHNVTSPEVMLQQSIDMGINIIACTMSMDLMGLRKEELVEGIDFGGAAAYVSESDDSNLTIFI
ncbi:MAG: DsrE/DsrF/DrsH-like family protein, partial [Mycoplasmataceae bacterium]|nr:DsrE/DsrF/DrsH-like family protein [Mycoplasmataceae bacterium]